MNWKPLLRNWDFHVLSNLSTVRAHKVFGSLERVESNFVNGYAHMPVRIVA